MATPSTESVNPANTQAVTDTPTDATVNQANGASSGSSTPAVPSTTSSLYVGDLAQDVTEAMLFEIFNQIGPVASIRVCRDAVTRRSLGYAYVNFHNSEDSERAIDELNFSLIKGRQCRIMFSQRDPSLRKRGNGNIFIKNLDKEIDSKALYDMFSNFGQILSCKVSMDENGSKGFGFVHFEEDSAAQKAIESLNGMMLNDKQIYVGLHVPRKDRESKEDEFKKNFTNVFLKNLPESMDEEKFQSLVGAFGEVVSAALSVDDDGKSKCFGFVNFVNHESAHKCVSDLNDKEIDGKVIYAGRAQKKNEREDELRKKFEQLRLERQNKYQGVNLYVKNLDETIDDERLRQEFAVYGTISSAKIMKDEKGDSKGFGFVCYSTPEEAAKAVAETNGKLIGNKPVFVALAQRKDTRRAMLEAQFATRMRQGMMPLYPMMYPQMPGMAMGGPAGQQQMPPFYPPMGAPMRPQMPMMRPQFQGNTNRAMNMMRPPRPGMYGPGMRPQMRPGMPPMPMRPGMSVRPGMPQQPPQLTAAVLAKLAPEQQRQVIGERLYGIVSQHPLLATRKEHAGKITGMLLEMEVSELLHLLESQEALTQKLQEAVQVLDNYLAQQQAAQQQQQQAQVSADGN